MNNQKNNFDLQTKELAQKFKLICNQDNLTSDVKMVDSMIEATNQFIDQINKSGNSELFTEYLKNELGLKNDSDVKKFLSSTPDEIEQTINN